MAVLVNGGNSQHVVCVTRFSGSHRLLIAGPMTLSQSCWNDEFERVAQSLDGGESKDSFRAGIPEGDCAGRIRDDNRVIYGCDQSLEIDGRLRRSIHRSTRLIMRGDIESW